MLRVSAPGVSPEVGGQDPQALPFVVFTTTGDKGTPSGATFSYPTFAAKHSCVLWGRAAWQFPFPTKPFRIKKEKQNKGNDQPSPSHQNWVKHKEGEVETSVCLATVTNQMGLITNPCVFRIRLTFWKSPKKSS